MPARSSKNYAATSWTRQAQAERSDGRRVDAALAALGSPEELASEYMTDKLLARAEVSRSPVRILESLFRWASLSVAGFFVFLASIVGYLLGVSFHSVRAVETSSSANRWIVDSSGQRR